MFENTTTLFASLTRPKVLILGLGDSGMAMARWCLKHGCEIRIADTRATPPRLADLNKLDIFSKSEFISGAFTPALLNDDIQLIAISPGLSPLTPDNVALLEAAREKEIPVWSELAFFAHALNTLATLAKPYLPKVLAITGTNGKTTTTSLTTLMCQRAGASVIVAGNIGPTLLDTLLNAIENNALPEIWVLELSSFQLYFSDAFNPTVAALLNITPDHLDWHGDFNAYAAAKTKIFGENTIRVLCRDDTFCASLIQENSDKKTITFGSNLPIKASDLGIENTQGMQWLVLATDINEDADNKESSPRRTKKQSDNHANEITIKRLMPIDALRIKGLHNATNALAALALCHAIELKLAPLLHALSDYAGEAHRVEWVAKINDIDYINDSKATNVGAVIAALNGLARSVILIAGGDSKNQNFEPLIPVVTRWCREVILIGRDAPILRKVFENAFAVENTLALKKPFEMISRKAVPARRDDEDSTSSTARRSNTAGAVFREITREDKAPLLIHDCESLQSAIQLAAKNAKAGDAVLLSPACASFDMFNSYAHRGAVFKQVVNELSSELNPELSPLREIVL